MIIDFENIEYLKTGNDRQRLAYNVLSKNEILTKLHPFDPILVGTIPISIDIESSDLDIICYYNNMNKFVNTIKNKFAKEKDFKIWQEKGKKENSIVANFVIDNFDIEIFGQKIPTRHQNAYRHMLIENRLLNEHGEKFKQKIIEMKRKGYKTEPAFAILLGLKRDPYVELLSYKIKNEKEIKRPIF